MLRHSLFSSLALSAALALFAGHRLTSALAAVVVPTVLTSYTKAPFTKEQATSGAKVYQANCAKCHGNKLENGYARPLMGAEFLGKWSKFTLDDFHFIISSSMPYTKPGSLKPEEYIAVTAYILQENGVKSGKIEMKAEDLTKYDFNK